MFNVTIRISSRVFTFNELQDYGVSVENIFEVQTGGCPSYEEIVKQPNKVLLWCGKTRNHFLRIERGKNKVLFD